MYLILRPYFHSLGLDLKAQSLGLGLGPLSLGISREKLSLESKLVCVTSDVQTLDDIA